MNNSFHLKALMLTATLLALPLAQAANLDKVDYNAAKSRISETYKADKTACASLSGNARDICVEEAKGKEKVARAELEYNYTGKVRDHNELLKVQAESAYDIAKEKCDDKAGNVKDVCIAEAKSAKTSALANAKLSKNVNEARNDANSDKRDAEYKVAEEKCDALAGDAKTNCVNAAKVNYGKS